LEVFGKERNQSLGVFLPLKQQLLLSVTEKGKAVIREMKPAMLEV